MHVPKSKPSSWRLEYQHYDPQDEGRREAVLALGNGYVVSRAAAPESLDNGTHYPGTYRVGCYNRLTSRIQGQEVENESLVNLPNWLSLTFKIDEGRWFSLDEVEILAYRQRLNLKKGILSRKIHFRDSQGRESRLREERFISMAQPHLMGLRLSLKAENWSGQLEVYAAIDGSVVNNNVKRYAPLEKQHLEILAGRRLQHDTLLLKARTRQSGIEVALGARTRLQVVNRQTAVERRLDHSDESRIADRLTLRVQQGDRVKIEKVASLYTSHDLAVADCADAAQNALARAGDFDALRAEHSCYWKQLWRRCQVELEDAQQLLYLRLHIFQILQNISPHTADIDVGVPPSGWQGEEYMGHIFWDEVFVFQFLSFRFPSIARSILLYRYRRLEEARHLAREQGYRGAMFPWRSASTGREETPLLQLNLYSGQWMHDQTRNQRHIGAIIAYNLCHYLQITGDQHFMEDYGAELLLEIARFWASLASYNPAIDRYEIRGVVGPDEYHTRYPHLKVPGISNNSYTNIMAAWTICQALQLLEQLPSQRKEELCEMMALESAELDLWDEVSRKIRVVFEKKGILSQFEGFDTLEEFKLEEFRKAHGKVRIDWWLQAQGDQVERYQVSKQADTSMLLYLLSPPELMSILERLGYTTDVERLSRTVDYHLSHTVHESSLSRIVYAGAYAGLNKEASWKLYKQAQRIDLEPEEHSDSTEGIHLGAMGGTLAVLQHHYMGIRVKGDTLEVAPALPAALKKVKMSLYFREVALSCEATHTQVCIRSLHQHGPTLQVAYQNHTKALTAGTSITFKLSTKEELQT